MSGSTARLYGITVHHTHTTWEPALGLWPMMRRVAGAGATRALRCRGWHEVRVDARTAIGSCRVPST
eukprot:3919498-Prymnesium_polylepis.1